MYLPKIFQRFTEEFPEITKAHEEMGKLASSAGPLDRKTSHLIQAGIAVGAASKGGVRSHVRQALAAGASEEEVMQAVLMAISTVGFPAMIAAYGWARDVIDSKEES